ncbi:hypothetical protein EGW08_016879 [Elysia chlorotica]|uniref:Kazal-like domain-containing protein n=1 Tax=Elysia chlorotica TaxID=188477 RepID=A0A433T1J0_ELYCH|nr:hypothetical protein EGW08_016879 [Elysia chlorotica]
MSSERCVNTPGSYHCDCLDGFVRDGYRCKADDTDRCSGAQGRCRATWDHDRQLDVCSASVAFRQCLDKVRLENVCASGPDYPPELDDADKTCINDEPKPDANGGLPVEPVFTSWTPFGACVYSSGDCGLGSQTRARQAVPYSDGRAVRQVQSYELQETRVCFIKCPGMTAADCPCSCVCDEAAPVCGAIGPGRARTFKSECELQLESCTGFYSPVKLYDGPCSTQDGASNSQMCSAGPRTKVMKFDEVRAGRRCVGEPVTIGTCQGLLCEGSSCSCCRPVQVDRIQVDLQCFGTDSQAEPAKDKHIYISATKCECATVTPAQ